MYPYSIEADVAACRRRRSCQSSTIGPALSIASHDNAMKQVKTVTSTQLSQREGQSIDRKSSIVSPGSSGGAPLAHLRFSAKIHREAWARF